MEVRLRTPKFPAWDVLRLCLQHGCATGLLRREGRLGDVVTPGFPNAESLGLRCSGSWKGLPRPSAAGVSRLVGLQD